jgi:hypothetical protein
VSAPRFINIENSCNAGSLETLHNLIDAGLFDAESPTQSLLLRKPLDVRDGGVTHGGGAKFSGTDDPSYESFLSFIEYWAKCGGLVY